ALRGRRGGSAHSRLEEALDLLPAPLGRGPLKVLGEANAGHQEGCLHGWPRLAQGPFALGEGLLQPSGLQQGGRQLQARLRRSLLGGTVEKGDLFVEAAQLAATAPEKQVNLALLL